MATSDQTFAPTITTPYNDGSFHCGDPDASEDTNAPAPPGDGTLLFTPDYLIDAENATVGQMYSGSASDQWSDASGGTTAQNTNVLFGTQAWRYSKSRAATGDRGGFGEWGGRKEFDAPLVKGQTVHCQWSVFLPSDFNWLAYNYLKFFRVYVGQPGGAVRGHIDSYIHQGGLEQDNTLGPCFDGSLALHNEVYDDWEHIYDNPQPDPRNSTNPQIMQKNVWETFEVEVTFDDVSVDSGGTGMTRIWRNIGGVMTLIWTNTLYNTLGVATDICPNILMFTYWNSGEEDGRVPASDQFCYGDRVVIQVDQSALVETDALGNKIIGGL